MSFEGLIDLGIAISMTYGAVCWVLVIWYTVSRFDSRDIDYGLLVKYMYTQEAAILAVAGTIFIAITVLLISLDLQVACRLG